MKIAALLTCYNRAETTLGCLKRFVSQALPDGCSIDIYLVDDASPDQTGERVRNWFHEYIKDHDIPFALKVIQGSGSLFWCRGMRLAWQSARESFDYDYYLWLNDDVRLNGDSVFAMIEESNFHSDNAIVYGSTTEDGTNNTKKTYGMTKYGDMNGNFVLIPRKVFETVGYIYDGYYHAYGDYDYAHQAIKHGIELIGCKKIVGQCIREPSRYSHLEGRNLLGRIKLLWDVKGYNLHDAVVFKYRKSGVTGAALTFFHVVWLVLKG